MINYCFDLLVKAILVMVAFFSGIVLFSSTAQAQVAEQPNDGWLKVFSQSLGQLDQERRQLALDLAALGAPVIGQTAPQFGYQHTRVPRPPITSPWLQIDLGKSQRVDRIVLIPAVLDWQADSKRTYGFPLRFRVDIAERDDFTQPTLVADFTNDDLPDPGIAPFIINVKQQMARFVRITVTKLAVENDQHFFALAEMLVLAGKRNIAIGAQVSASAALNIPPRWVNDNLVDGRTPLGPPIRVELLPWDGLFAGSNTDDAFSFMSIDLGQMYELQEIRLYATHARLGADIPGFNFPPRFIVDIASRADFSDAKVVLDASAKDFLNPGDNAITIPIQTTSAHFVRVRMPDGNKSRFSLSEIEVYADDINVARDKTVMSSRDPSKTSGLWPRSLLVDGFISYGQLLELPTWIDLWEERLRLTQAISRVDLQRVTLVEQARRRFWWVGLIGTVVGVAFFGGWVMQQRRRRAHELDALRRRMARDMHDEIGSNLAAISRLSEVSVGADATSDDWQEVHRIAGESMDGMREVLWLAGAREEAGPELATHMKRLVQRLLSGHEVRWLTPLDTLPSTWSSAARREIFLFCKESFANIVRHAQARVVELDMMVHDGVFRIDIRDDGIGYDPETVRRGMGLHSLHERARTLGGTMSVTTSPGNGTRLQLLVPVAKLIAPGIIN